ncbi:hypothetical protein DRN63_04130 [Nanoarchaeota archaeon]|nr:MAG: hypothetical protein DRN63_04130 [Nanoarchaeota archaeon]
MLSLSRLGIVGMSHIGFGIIGTLTSAVFGLAPTRHLSYRQEELSKEIFKLNTIHPPLKQEAFWQLFVTVRRLNLPVYEILFLTLIKSIRKCVVDLNAVRQLAIRAFLEGLSLFKVEVSELDRELMRLGILDEPLRVLHEMVCKLPSGRES